MPRQKTAWFILVLALSACAPLIPATTPPQLQQTPGAFIVVDGTTVQFAGLAVAIPPQWRVVKSSIAAEPLTLVFVTPDGQNAITLSLGEATIPAAEREILYETRQLADGAVLAITGTYVPDTATTATFLAGWAMVLDSLPD